MPDFLTRHPDTARRVLESGAGECGSNLEPRILTECPAGQLCRFPDGEVCIYGVEQINRIPQMPVPMLRTRLPSRPSFSWYDSPLLFLILIPLLIGYFAGAWFQESEGPDSSSGTTES